jgi:hypothetical protein
VWFAYSPDRKGEHPQAHLADFTGVLQADAYAGYVAVRLMLWRSALGEIGGPNSSLETT